MQVVKANAAYEFVAGNGKTPFGFKVCERRTFESSEGIAPTAAAVGVSGRVLTAYGSGIRNARVILTDQNGISRSVVTSAFGYYNFAGVEAGTTCMLSVSAKRFVFAPRVVTVSDELTDLNFVATP